jgi:hypothetical protein
MTWIIKSLVFDFAYDLGYFTRAKIVIHTDYIEPCYYMTSVLVPFSSNFYVKPLIYSVLALVLLMLANLHIFALDKQVMMQLLVGLGLCMWAGLAVPAKFLSVLPQSEENR